MKTPAIFFGHGSPMNALGGPYAEAWRALALEKPRAILMVSAHWETDGPAVTVGAAPRTIHDFTGFPPALYAIRYPAPGEAWLAERVAGLLAPAPVVADPSWGLDHGTWSVLMHVFPDADVPIVQLGLDTRRPAQWHYDLARRLAPLREENVLIAGSGDIVHNLRHMQRAPAAAPHDWAARFHERAKRAVAAGDHGDLIAAAAEGGDAALAIPTPEHYLPLLYVLAQQAPGEAVAFFNDSIDLAAISMLGVRIG